MVTIQYRLGVLLLCAMVIGEMATQAQTTSAAMPRKIYTRKTAFRLPVSIEEKDRASLDKVQLYVKNGIEGAWRCQETAPATQREFRFNAEHDGEYWFSVVTVDKNGKTVPADVTRQAPGLVVVVDTQPPDFELQTIPSANGELFLRCTLKDANPDYGKTKIEYQTARGWQVLEPLRGQQGIFRVPFAKMPDLVRVTVCDQAGNCTTRVINPLGDKAYSTSDSHSTSTASESSSGKTAWPSSEAGPVRQPSTPNVWLINSPHPSLNYQIDGVGPSGIGKVEVWMTRDEGQTWQRVCEDPDRRSPVEFELPGDGLYGISLVVTNGNGIGNPPPSKGDAPNWWVEVDTTKPEAQLSGIRPAGSGDGNTFLITWSASDKNLKSDAIDLYYCTQRDGLWIPIARGLANTGSYRWSVPQAAGSQFYVRMEVTDRAGNMTRYDWPQPVVLDYAKPKARVVGIAASGYRPTSFEGN